MIIIVPTKWEEVNLLTEQDPNKFGEALRAYCFVGNCEQTGCYSTFEIMPHFKHIKSGKIYEEAKTILTPSEEDNFDVYHFLLKEKNCYMNSSFNKQDQIKVNEPYEIVCAWLWDGDGILYFRFNNRRAKNSDCKTSYGWEWVEC